jgi:hypothetical protein
VIRLLEHPGEPLFEREGPLARELELELPVLVLASALDLENSHGFRIHDFRVDVSLAARSWFRRRVVC